MAEPILAGWPDYLKWRDKFHVALDPAFYTGLWLDGEVLRGEMQLFANENAAILASIKVYPTGLREVHGQMAVGKLGDILDLIPLIETWARSIGCATASISSRAGWSRMLRKSGYSVYQTTIRKAL